jgi:AraC-like DNA-binding protein
MPARALWNTSVECADVAGPAGRELWERLQGLTAWADRFAACDTVLTRIADRDLTVAPELRGVWQTLVRTGGTDPIGNLAATVGWSRQHLARWFRDEFGFGPKLAARVVRFERARHMLQAIPSFVTIAQVAAACGYYDQAHLDRDFAELAGCTPTAWLAEELPSFQDDAAVAV